MTTIGLVANVYNEVNALPGWLECHLPFFDDVRVLHAGPGGAYSHDGTLELLSKWRIPVEYCPIDDGYGAVRTRALRMCPCDWVMLLDADERFHATSRVMRCDGTQDTQEKVDFILQKYDFHGVNLPNWENVAKLGDGLRVDYYEVYDQGQVLRAAIGTGQYDAIATIRRHWHDLGRTRPTQDWHQHPDWQMRCVRRDDAIHFSPEVRIHEQLVGAHRVHQADMAHGPFFDHQHFWFKRMEQEQRAHDVAIYDAVHEGRKPPSWQNFRGGMKLSER